MVSLLTHNPSPNYDENYPKIIKMPSFCLIESDEDAKSIIKKVYEHLPHRECTIDAPLYNLVASIIFDDDDFKPADLYTPVTENVADAIISYFFENTAFSGRISAIRVDVFSGEYGKMQKELLDEKHYISTTVFYNCLK